GEGGRVLAALHQPQEIFPGKGNHFGNGLLPKVHTWQMPEEDAPLDFELGDQRQEPLGEGRRAWMGGSHRPDLLEDGSAPMTGALRWMRRARRRAGQRISTGWS